MTLVIPKGWFFDAVEVVNTVGLVDAILVDDHLWTSDGTKVYVYNIWGHDDFVVKPTSDSSTWYVKDYLNKDIDTYHDLISSDFRSPKKVIEFTVENGAGKLCYGNGVVYITDSVNFTSFVIVKADFTNLHNASGTYTLRNQDVFIHYTPTYFLHNGTETKYAMNSDIIYAYGKIWMVSYAIDATLKGSDTTDSQFMFSFDGTSWNQSIIPSRKQELPVRLADGYNGFVYATRYNSLCISKFANSTGAWVSNIRVNAEPAAITTLPNGSIIVGSYAGMVSVVNPATDVVTHTYNTLLKPSHFVDMNDGYIWSCSQDGKRLLRLKKSNNAMLFSTNAEQDAAAKAASDAQEAIKEQTIVKTGFKATVTGMQANMVQNDLDPLNDQLVAADDGVNGLVKDTHDAILDAPLAMPDYKLENVETWVGADQIDKIMNTNDRDYYYWNGSAIQKTTAYARMFVVIKNKIYIIRNKDHLYRKPNVNIQAYGYITTGSNDYAGD
jgi:hypothetical protein